MQRELTARRLDRAGVEQVVATELREPIVGRLISRGFSDEHRDRHYMMVDGVDGRVHYVDVGRGDATRSEEHTSELQSLMRTSYAVFCLKQKKRTTITTTQ